MIKITIVRNRDDRSIDSFEVSGHAGYAKRGTDIVCAGVSAVTVGTVNAAEAVAGVALDVVMRDDGYLQARVPRGLSPSASSNVQLQLESMVVMLDSIRESYEAYISLDEIER